MFFSIRPALAAVVLMLVLVSEVSGQLGLNSGRIKWEKVSSPAVNVIYPPGMEASAQRIANMVNYQQSKLGSSVGIKKKNLNIVLQNRTVEPNGYVGLAPFRSEFYATPPEEMQVLGSLGWLDVLSIHEYRHVQQFVNARSGATRIMSVLFGQSAWVATHFISIPNWYMEGDAVWAETSFTRAGRGRAPFFTSKQRALLQDGVQYRYQKMRNGSYKDIVPNQYPVGYTMLSYLRNEKGRDIMAPVLKESGAYKRGFYPFSSALKVYTGYTTTSLYSESFNQAEENWKKRLDTVELRKTTTITERYPKTVTNYYYPQYGPEGKIYALRTTYKTTDEIVEIDGPTETVIVRPGQNLASYFNVSSAGLVWTEYRQNPRRNNENFSDIVYYSFSEGKKSQLTKKGKYFSPVLHPSSDQIAAIYVTPEQEVSIRIVDIQTGEASVLKTFDKEYFVSRLSYNNDGSELVYVLKRRGQLSITKLDVERKQETQLTPWSAHIINAPSVQDGYVYFSASYSGIDNIYRAPLEGNKKVEKVSSVPVGAYQPSVHSNGRSLLMTEQTSRGRVISKMDVAVVHTGNSEITIMEPADMIWQDKISADSAEIIDFPSNVPTKEYPSEKYSGFLRGLRLHSWELGGNFVVPSMNLKWNNYLDDVGVIMQAGYNTNEQSPFYNIQLQTGRWYPLLGLTVGNAYRSSPIVDSSGVLRIHDYFQQSVGVNASLPLTWIKGNYYMDVSPLLRYAYVSARNRALTSGETRPDAQFHYVMANPEFFILRRTAVQNLASRLGIAGGFTYARNLEQFDNEKFNVYGKAYLPGFSQNHSLRISGAYQFESLRNSFQQADFFQYARGYVAPYNDEVKRFTAEYAFPLAYPDWGFWGITYFKRIKTNLFTDLAQSKNLVDGTTRKFHSAGVEFIFDNTYLNLLEVSSGVRFSYRVQPGYINTTQRLVPEFFVSGQL